MGLVRIQHGFFSSKSKRETWSFGEISIDLVLRRNRLCRGRVLVWTGDRASQQCSAGTRVGDGPIRRREGGGACAVGRLGSVLGKGGMGGYFEDLIFLFWGRVVFDRAWGWIEVGRKILLLLFGKIYIIFFYVLSLEDEKFSETDRLFFVHKSLKNISKIFLFKISLMLRKTNKNIFNLKFQKGFKTSIVYIISKV